jgi:hypothetical protein
MDSPVEFTNKVFTEQLLQIGGMVNFSNEMGANQIVFGRSPTARYGEGERPPVEIGQGILPVKLLGTISSDTSRQQFGIERRGNGPFMLINYSKQALNLDGVSDGKRELAPGMTTKISPDAQGMQRVKIGWKGGCEVSVQSVGVGSNDERWQIGFVWKKPDLTSSR